MRSLKFTAAAARMVTAGPTVAAAQADNGAVDIGMGIGAGVPVRLATTWVAAVAAAGPTATGNAVSAPDGLNLNSLAQGQIRAHAPGMFAVDEQTAEAIRRAYDDGGELSGIVEFKRHFPLISSHDRARLCVRTIVSWTTPLPAGGPRGRGRRRKPTQAA